LGVSAESVKSFLESALLFSSLSEDQRNKYLSMYEAATKTTTAITGMPGGGGSDRNATLANLGDAETSLHRWEEIVEKKREVIKSFIRDAEIDPYYKDILWRRYIMGTSWDMILLILRDKQELSQRKLFYDHNKALEACAAWVNETGKYKEEVLNK